jgi:hypothetical protein
VTLRLTSPPSVPVSPGGIFVRYLVPVSDTGSGKHTWPVRRNLLANIRPDQTTRIGTGIEIKETDQSRHPARERASHFSDKIPSRDKIMMINIIIIIISVLFSFFAAPRPASKIITPWASPPASAALRHLNYSTRYCTYSAQRALKVQR